MSKREDIASNIVTVITNISSPDTKKVTRQPFNLEELSQTQYPAVLVQTQTEEKLSAQNGIRNSTKHAFGDWFGYLYWRPH